MKKILLLFPLLALSLQSGAQDMYYAKMLSQNNYYGTARTMAMGNAVTAVGGDLGTIAVNPAGSAVASYGQFTISPGLAISCVNTAYSPYGNQDTYSNSESRTKVTLPNLGISLVMNTGNSYGLKSMTFAFTSSCSNNFLRYSRGYGRNDATSMLGSLAWAAYGYSDSELGNSNNVNWDLYAAYAANQFGGFGNNGEFVGSNQALDEADIYAYLPGTINQNSSTNTWGSKNDVLLNLGFNISDRLFIGLNIGIPTLRYDREDLFTESPVDPDQFGVIFINNDTPEVAQYLGSSNSYRLKTRADGIYAKIGVIALPVNNLRIGASIQTPTAFTISESWVYSAETNFDKSRYSGTGRSPIGDYNYCLRSPWSFSVGAAYTFFERAMLSVDYERTDYSVMKYSDVDTGSFDTDYFASTNLINSKFCGASNNVRIGVELRLTDKFSLRGGYGIISDPERHWTDATTGERITSDNYLNSVGQPSVFSLVNPVYVNKPMKSLSFGLGYASYGSFYADLAARINSYPATEYAPYYYSDYVAYDKNGKVLEVGTPVQSIRNRLWDVVMTLGWRF